jgi:Glycosyltransferase
MLKAFSQLKSNAELHLIGTCGSSRHERNYMSSLQRKYKSHSNIIWHGQQTEAESIQLIANYDIMLHPAIYLEVFGLSIAEALAMGKYVIATRCGGAEMQIEDGVNGTLIPTNNVISLSKAIKETINKKCQSSNIF